MELVVGGEGEIERTGAGDEVLNERSQDGIYRGTQSERRGESMSRKFRNEGEEKRDGEINRRKRITEKTRTEKVPLLSPFSFFNPKWH